MIQYWRVLALALGLMAVGLFQVYGLFSNAGYAPEQPIPYSHVLHAGVMEMECLYCHSSAEKGAHASVPSVDVCMGCHAIVQKDKPTIKKLKEYYDSGKPVPWVRIHNLPDHSYFNHKWHVAAGVACQTCHGPIQNMAVVGQWQKLEMGACMTCHRQDTYVDGIHHPQTFAEQPITHGDIADATVALEKADLESDEWVSATREFKKYDLGQYSPDERKVILARLKAYKDDIYQHGRTAQARNKNASVECNTCHH